MAYQTIEEKGFATIKHWTNGVQFEDGAKTQVRYMAQVPCVAGIAIMPDVHSGIGSTIGSVVATRKAIIPACVGVDLGCGIFALKTSLTSHQVSENGKDMFEALSKYVPFGGGKGKETGNWECSKEFKTPENVKQAFAELEPEYRKLIEKNGQVSSRNAATQLGTGGSGNHFMEVCLDEADAVWLMLHSGSRGAGNRIGAFFIETAKKEMDRLGVVLPSRDLAYLQEGTEHFNDYVEAVAWAQKYALVNRQLMMENALRALSRELKMKFEVVDGAVNIHHNYVQLENHFDEEVWITRKGAVSAESGRLGVIPGSMGAKSFITRGKGCAESYNSCSHGAGRVMSRSAARDTITHDQHIEDTKGVFCDKSRDVIDESPRAYKDIDAVMAAQDDLVEVLHTLKQIVCIKG